MVTTKQLNKVIAITAQEYGVSKNAVIDFVLFHLTLGYGSDMVYSWLNVGEC